MFFPSTGAAEQTLPGSARFYVCYGTSCYPDLPRPVLVFQRGEQVEAKIVEGDYVGALSTDGKALVVGQKGGSLILALATGDSVVARKWRYDPQSYITLSGIYRSDEGAYTLIFRDENEHLFYRFRFDENLNLLSQEKTFIPLAPGGNFGSWLWLFDPEEETSILWELESSRCFSLNEDDF